VLQGCEFMHTEKGELHTKKSENSANVKVAEMKRKKSLSVETIQNKCTKGQILDLGMVAFNFN